MKKAVYLFLGLVFVSVSVFAQTDKTEKAAVKPAVVKAAAAAVVATPAVPAAPVVEAAPVKEAEEMVLKGDIIDNNCANALKPDKLAEFVKGHLKACTLMPNCVASGYSIYSDGKLHKFDKPSNAKIEEFLKVAENKLQVVVKAKKTAEGLSLVSIENQK
jgi:hypothetical protein